MGDDQAITTREPGALGSEEGKANVATDRLLVTIGIPTLDDAALIGETLRSALAQTYSALEVIVIDRGSSDETLEMVRGVGDPRVRVESLPGASVSAAHDHAVGASTGRYIKMLHPGDLVAADAVERLVAAMVSDGPTDRQPAGTRPVLATSRRTVIDEAGKRIVARGPKWQAGTVPGASVAREIVRSGHSLLGGASAQLLDREAVLAVGGFSEEWPHAVDLELALRLLAVGDVAFVPEELCSIRVGADVDGAYDAESHEAEMESLLTAFQDRWSNAVTAEDLTHGLLRMRRELRIRRLLSGVLAISPDTREKFAYLVVGVWNTIFSYLVFALLWALLGKTAPYWVVLTISTLIGIVNSFVNQRRFVFRSTGSVFKEFARFSVVYLFLLVVNIVVFPALTNVLGLNAYVAQLVYMVFVVVFGYIANKYFSFKERSSEDA